MRVVEDEERKCLLASGFWYDSPAEARKAREKVEKEIKDEPKPKQKKAKVPNGG
jgi:hypothetical protein